ncbi:mucin-2-like isoform X5 [Sycon ciliatum]|uniref:mucin-2-like isoform X5 n=1 Tax=Sycon ciliatum TaxID=27933 RepID=UPI0031F613A5
MERSLSLAVLTVLLVASTQAQTLPSGCSCSASGLATYAFTFDADWINPSPPVGAHWSWPIGAAHSPCTVVWRDGQLASAGVKQVAELGSTGTIQNEFTAAKVLSTFRGDLLGKPLGSTSRSFTVNRYYPLVSALSMIAPSPDWFVGVDSFSLCSGSTWTSSATIPLYAWDAGTDSGLTFGAANLPTSPPENIARLAGARAANTNFQSVLPAVPLGNFTFRLSSVDSTATVTDPQCSMCIAPTTQPLPTTGSPTTASPTTASPTTASPTTASPTTASPTTGSPTTGSPTTASPTTTSVMPGGGCPQDSIPFGKCPTLCNVSDPTYNCSQGQLCCADNCGGAKCTKACPVLRCSPCSAYVYDNNSCPTCQCQAATTPPPVSTTTAVGYQIGGGCPDVSTGFGICPTNCDVDANCTTAGELCCKNQCGSLQCTAVCTLQQCPVKCAMYTLDSRGCQTCTCIAATTPPPVSTTTAVGYQIGGGCPDVSTGFGICPTNCDVDANCTTAGELCCKNQCGSLQCTAVCTLRQCPVKCAMYTLDSRGCQTCTCIAATTPPPVSTTTAVGYQIGGGCPDVSTGFGICPTNCDVDANCTTAGELCCKNQCGSLQCTAVCTLQQCPVKCAMYTLDSRGCQTCTCIAATTPPPVSTTTAVGYQIGGGCPDVSTGFGICPTNCDVDANCTTAGELCCKNQCGSLQCTAVCTLQQCPVKCAMYTLDSRGCQTCTCIAATTPPPVSTTTAVGYQIGGGCPDVSTGFGICPTNCDVDANCTTAGELCCKNQCGSLQCTAVCTLQQCPVKCAMYTLDSRGCQTCTCIATTPPPVSTTTAVGYQIGGGCPDVSTGFGICPTNCDVDANCTTAGELCCKNQCGSLQCTAVCTLQQCPVKCAMYTLDSRGCQTCTCIAATTPPPVSTTTAVGYQIGGGCPDVSTGFGICPTNCDVDANCTTAGELCCKNQCGSLQCTAVCTLQQCPVKCAMYTLDSRGCQTCTCIAATTPPPVSTTTAVGYQIGGGCPDVSTGFGICPTNCDVDANCTTAGELCCKNQCGSLQCTAVCTLQQCPVKCAMYTLDSRGCQTCTCIAATTPPPVSSKPPPVSTTTAVGYQIGGGCPDVSTGFGICPTNCDVDANCTTAGELCCKNQCGSLQCTAVCTLQQCPVKCAMYTLDSRGCQTCTCIAATTPPPVSTTTAVGYQIGGGCPDVSTGFGICPTNCDVDANCTTAGELCCKNQCGSLQCTAVCTLQQCPVKCAMYTLDSRGCQTCTCIATPPTTKATTVPRTTQLVAQTTAIPTSNVTIGGGCPKQSGGFGICPSNCGPSKPCTTTGDQCCANTCGGTVCTKPCAVLTCSSSCTAYTNDVLGCPTCTCVAVATTPASTKPATTAAVTKPASTPAPQTTQLVAQTTAIPTSNVTIGGGCPKQSGGFGICPSDCGPSKPCTTTGDQCCANTCGGTVCTKPCAVLTCSSSCTAYTNDVLGCPTCTCVAVATTQASTKPATTAAVTKPASTPAPRTTQLVAQTTAIPTSNVTIGGGCPKQSGGFGICPSNCGPSKPCTTTGDQCCANTCGGTVCTKPCAVLTCSSSCTAYTNDVLGCPTCTCTVLTTAPPTKPATTGRTSTKPATTGRTSTKPSPQTTVSPTTTQPSATTPASQIGGGCPVVQAGFGICPTDCSRDSDCTTAGQLCCKNQCRGLVCAAACARLTCALACATFATDTRGCPVCACSTAATKPSTTQATTNRPTTAPRTTGPRATTGTSTTNAMTSAAGQSSGARTTGASMTTASGTIGTRMPSSPSSSGPQEMTPSMSRRTTRIPVGTSASMAPQTPSPTTIVTEATRPPTTIPEIAIGHDVEVTLVLSIGSAAALDGVSTHEDEFVKFVIAQLQTSYGLSSEQIDDEGKFKVSSNTAASHTVQVTVTMKATSNQDTAPFEVASRIQSDVESGRLTLTNFEVGSQSYAVRPAQASTQVTDDVYEPEESSSNTGAIVGGVIGGLCGVVGFVSLVYYLRTKGDSRHRHRKGSIPMRSPTISQSTMTGSLQFEADAITNEGATDHATV